MSKTFKRLLIGFFVLLTLTALGLYVARLAILDWGLHRYLRDNGVAPASFQAVEVDGGRLVLRNIALGEEEFSLSLFHVTYSLTGLMRGQVEQIFVDGLRVKLDLTGDGPPLGKLQGLLSQGGGTRSGASRAGAGGRLSFPAIAIQNSVILAETPTGPAKIQIEGELWSDEAGAPQGAVSYNATSKMGGLKGLVALSGQADGRVIGNVILDEGSLTLPQAKASNLVGGGGFVLPDGTLDNLGLELEFSMDDLVFVGEGLPTPPFESARVSTVIEDGDARMTVDLTEADQGLVLQLFAAAEDYRGKPQAALSAILDLPPSSQLWQALSMAPPDGGGLRLDLNASGPVPDPEALLEAALEDPWSLTEAGLTFDLALSSEGLNLPDLAEGLNGRLDVSGSLAGGSLSLRVEDGSTMTLAKPAAALREQLGLAYLPADALLGLSLGVEEGRPLEAQVSRQEDSLAVAISGALTLATDKSGSAHLQGEARFGLDQERRLAAVEQAGFDLALTDIALQGHRVDRANLAATLAGPAGDLTGRVTSQASIPNLVFGDLEARGLRASLKGELAVRSGQLSLAVSPSSNVQAREVILADGIALQETLELTVGPGDLTVTQAEAGSIALRHKIGLTLQGNSLAIEREGEPPLTLEFTPAPLSLDGSMTGDLGYALAARLQQTNVSAPELEVEAKGLRIEANYNSGLQGLGLAFKANSIADSGLEPRFTPLILRGQLTQTAEDSFHVTAKAGWPEAPDSLVVEAELHPGEARGAAEVLMGPFDFVPGGLQPANLSPLMGDLEAVGGKSESHARFSWSSDGLVSSGNLGLENLSFTTDGTKVEGLNLDLELTDLAPPASLANQRLVIEALDPGLPVEDLNITFRVLPGDLPIVQIDGGRFQVLGGEFGIEPTTLDPASERHDLTFEIRNLALESLFETLELEGVSGEGALDGRVPIRLEGSTFAIADGQLSARGPGRLHIRSEEAEDLIGQKDENVDSMLAALRDFYFEEFTVTLDKNSNEDLTLALSVLGNNPDVLDGQKFQINVNLESNIGNILNALSESLAVSDQKIKDLWRRFK